MFQNSFNYVSEEFPPNLQLKRNNLKCNDILKGKYLEKNLTEFYKCLSCAQGLILVFGRI